MFPSKSFVSFETIWKYFVSALRRGGGRNKSSSEKVRAVAPPGGCGLLRLKMDGLRIPSRPNIVRGAPGVVAVDCGTTFVNCNCSRNDWWWWWPLCIIPGAEAKFNRNKIVHSWSIAAINYVYFAQLLPREVSRFFRENVFWHTIPIRLQPIQRKRWLDLTKMVPGAYVPITVCMECEPFVFHSVILPTKHGI